MMCSTKTKTEIPAVNLLIEYLNEIPPRYDLAERFIANRSVSPYDLARVACSITEDCYMEYADILYQEYEEDDIPTSELYKKHYDTPIPDDAHSRFLYKNLEFLLKHGMDPSVKIAEDDYTNAFFELKYVDCPYVAPLCCKLLLEAGCDPNLDYHDNTGSFYQNLDSDVCFDNEYLMYDLPHQIKLLLVLSAYGAFYRGKNGKKHQSFTMLDSNNIEIFKDIESFDYRIDNLEDRSKRQIIIFDTHNHKDVARFNW